MKSTAQAILVFMLLAQTSVFADEVIFSDNTFNLSDWNLSNFNTGNGETVVASQENDGAPQNEYRRITHTTTNGSTSYIQGRHTRIGWEYDPGVSGSIDSMFVEYKVQKPATDPYYFGIGFLLEQDGELFYDSSHYLGLPPSHTSWFPISYNSLQSDFTVLGGTGAILDFSTDGAPIHFGLFTANSFDPNHPTGFTSSYNVDDFVITVSSSVPEPGTSVVLAAMLLAVVGRRKRRC